MELHSLFVTFLRRATAPSATCYDIRQIASGGQFKTCRVAGRQGDADVFSAHLRFKARRPLVSEEAGHRTNAATPRKSPRGPRDRRKAAPPGLNVVWADYPGEDGRDAVWMRSRGHLGGSEALHAAAVIYASDYPILEAALPHHRLSWWTPNLFTTSLTHAVWIMKTIDFNDWHHFSIDSPTASRGLAIGRVVCSDAAGEVVAVFVQEAVIRTARGT